MGINDLNDLSSLDVSNWIVLYGRCTVLSIMLSCPQSAPVAPEQSSVKTHPHLSVCLSHCFRCCCPKRWLLRKLWSTLKTYRRYIRHPQCCIFKLVHSDKHLCACSPHPPLFPGWKWFFNLFLVLLKSTTISFVLLFFQIRLDIPRTMPHYSAFHFIADTPWQDIHLSISGDDSGLSCSGSL